MAKQLSIVAKVIDQATGPLRGIQGLLGSLGAGVGSVFSFAGRALSGVVGLMTSAQGLLLGLVGAAGVGLLVQQLSAATQELDDLNATATRTGLAVKTLSELKYMAKLSNIEFSELAGGVSSMQKNVARFVRDGGGRAADTLRLLNVRLTETNGRVRDAGDLLPEFAAAIQALPDAASQVEAAGRVFGDPRFLQLLKEAPGSIRQMAEEARALGVSFGEEQVQAAARLSDAVDRLGQAWLGVRAKIIGAVGPALEEILQRAAAVVAALPEIVSRGIAVVRAALGGDGEAMALLRNLQQSALEIVEFTANSAGVIILGTLRDALVIMPRVLWPAAKAVGSQLVQAIGEGMAEGIEKYGSFLGFGPQMINLFYKDYADDMRGGVAELMEQTPGQVQEFWQSVSEAMNRSTVLTEEFWQNMMVDAHTVGGRVLEDLDGILGASEAVMGRLAALRGASAAAAETAQVGPMPMAPGYWEEFAQGASQAWNRIGETARDAMGFAREAVTSVTQAVSGGLATAIVDAVSGAKSFGAAFAEVGNSVLRLIAEMTLRMAILRTLVAVTGGFGIGSGLAGPGSGEAAAAAGLPGFFADGGRPPVGRVSIVGERGPELFVPDRPGRIVPNHMMGELGMGASVTVSQTINISGGGGVDQRQLAAIKDATTRGVLDALAKSPRMRDELRRLL